MQLRLRSRQASPRRVLTLNHVSPMDIVTQGGDAGNLSNTSVTSLICLCCWWGSTAEVQGRLVPCAHLFSTKTQHSFLLILTVFSPVVGDPTLIKELNKLVFVTFDHWAAGRL